MTSHSLQACFEPLDGHRSLVVRWQPAARVRAQALFVPAFGDEMNQSRRMVRLAAEALAAHGVASTVFDLHGTGDSSAGFAEGTVQHWLADCRTMAARVATAATPPLVLVGCRLGVALAAQSSHDLAHPAAALVGWAPVLQGRAQLSGLLRAAALARSQRAEAGEAEPRTRWAAGQVAMLGGYPVSPALAEELEAFDARRAPHAVRVTLIDVRVPVGEGPVTASEALRKRAQAWNDAGTPAEVMAVAGAGFWNVADLVDVPALVEHTVAAVEAALAGRAA